MVDQLGIDVGSEEVLFSILLEVCSEAVGGLRQAGGKPSQRLYGALLKVSSVFNRVHRCRGYWQDMVQEGAAMANRVCSLYVGRSRPQ